MTETIRVDSIVVPTAWRPQSVRRALLSITTHLSRYGRAPEIFICDASDDETMLSTTMEAVSTAATRYSGAIRLAGRQDALTFAAALSARSAVEPSVVEFGLFGVPGTDEKFGASRNRLLLMRPQRLLLSSDDDVVWRPGWPRHLSSRDGYRVIGDEVERELWSCSCRCQTIAHVEPADECILDAHEAVLGRNIGRVLSDLRDRHRPLSAFRPCQHMRVSLRTGTGSVAMTCGGLYGDSGMHSPFRAVCFSYGRSFSHLISSESTCAGAYTSREVVSSPPELTLSHGGPWMGTVTGVDNRDILPPYCPVGRNEDGVFGALLRTCMPDAYFAHLPLCVLHAPPERHFYGQPWLPDLVRPRLCDAIGCSLDSFERTPAWRDPRRELMRLGEHLQDLARMPSRDLHQFLGCLWRRRIATRLAEIEGSLIEHDGAPQFWRRLARRCFSVCEAYLRDGDPSRDIALSGGHHGPIGALLGRYGALLGAWPALVAAAVTIEQG